jgi:hypothetical protein
VNGVAGIQQNNENKNQKGRQSRRPLDSGVTLIKHEVAPELSFYSFLMLTADSISGQRLYKRR